MRLYRGEPFMHGAQRQVDERGGTGCWFMPDPRGVLQYMESDAGQLYILDVTPTEIHPDRTLGNGKVYLITAPVARRAQPVPLDYTRHPVYDAERFGPNPVFDPARLDRDGHVR